MKSGFTTILLWADKYKWTTFHSSIKECYGIEKWEQSITWLTIDQTKAMSPTKINVIGEYINCKKLILL